MPLPMARQLHKQIVCRAFDDSAAEALVAALENDYPPESQSENVRAAVAAVRSWVAVMDRERAIALRSAPRTAAKADAPQ
jgi:hypothetical protein